MVNVFGKNYTKRDFLAYFGDSTGFAGILPSVMDMGKGNGVKIYRVFTGAGLDFTVVPSRGLDIAWASYDAKSLAFISKAGMVNPTYYESRGLEWLRGFFGGLLTTCGITYMGAPNTDEGVDLGIHGRMSYAEAEDIIVSQDWVGDDLVLTVGGKTREGRLFTENIHLSRKITAKAGENKIQIEDTYENLGFNPEPLQLLYHMNFGHPLLSPDSKLYLPTTGVIARDPEAEAFDGVKNYNIFQPPTHNFKEQVYFHKLKADAKGNTMVVLYNKPLGLGIYESFNVKELPEFTEWKSMAESDYVLGLEPGTGTPMGRSILRKQGKMQQIEPGQKYSVKIELGVITSEAELKTKLDLIKKIEG